MENKEAIDEDHFLTVKNPVPKNINLFGNSLLSSILKSNNNITRNTYNPQSKLNINNTLDDINTNDSSNTKTSLINAEENNNDNNDINTINNENPEKKDKPSFYSSFINNLISHSKKTEKGWFSSLFSSKSNNEEETEESELPKKLSNKIINVNYIQKGKKSNVQVLRSSAFWSAGINPKEDSILQAYIKLIRESQHCIYIENQFFVSRPYDEKDKASCSKTLSEVVKNTIAYEIRQRIIKAYEENKKFRVIIFIPLLPGFAGNPEESGTLQIILKHTYSSICRNKGTSIIEKLKEKMGNLWKKYISFFSLRNHDIVNGIPTTEIIYIHSKLMIVDDKQVIIGSANINDRSMLGSRDSEFCVLIEEKLNKKNFFMDGKITPIAEFARSFRVNLLAEHLGLDPKNEIFDDPLSDIFWEKLNETAKKNTEIYRKLWLCYPDDTMTKFEHIKKMKKIGELNENEIKEFKKLYLKEKGNIKGHIVEFPLHFLEDEALGIAFFSKENIVPEKNYT